jgi:hypothetical protein
VHVIPCLSGGSTGSRTTLFLPFSTTGVIDGVSLTHMTTIQSYFAFAPLIQINWQASDIVRTSSTLSQNSSVPAAPGSTPLPKPNSAPTGLSVGAKAGIGVGATLVVLALSFVILSVCHRRRKARRRKEPSPHELEDNPTMKRTELDAFKKPSELGGGLAHELGTETEEQKAELEAGTPPSNSNANVYHELGDTEIR